MIEILIITKNERERIRPLVKRCLRISPVVRVIDTGSTDGTAKIARESGAKVHAFKWIDDFAAARNYALSLCDADVACFFDSDHIPFKPETIKKDLEYFEGSDHIAASLTIYDAKSESVSAASVVSGEGRSGAPYQQFLAFKPKAKAGPIFRGCIHEDASVWIKGEKTLFLFNSHIIHLGNIRTEIVAKQKSERNANLLFRRIASNPSDGVAYSYLIHEYLSHEDAKISDLDAIVKAGSPVVFADPECFGIHRIRYTVGAAIYHLRMSRAQECLDLVDKSIALEGRHSDLVTLRALALRQKGKPIASAKLLEEACRSYGSATESMYFMDPNKIAAHYMGQIEGARCVGLA